MSSLRIFAATAALLASVPAIAQETKVAIGISGWTGFAPLTLANQAGIFKKNGLDVTIKKIPQKDRHLAVASGDIQCARRAANATDRTRLGVRKTGKVVAISCRHSADGVPFAIEDRLIDLDAVPEAATADFAIEPPGTWLLHHVPWTEAEHSISAIVADEQTATALDIAIGAPCLVIDRHTWRSARTLTAVRLVYPGESHKLVARFKGG